MVPPERDQLEEFEEPFGHAPDDLPAQPDDEALDPRVAGNLLPVRPPRSVSGIPHRYRRSAGASVLAAGLIGLREVIDPAKVDEETVMEQPASDATTEPAVEVYLDPDDPAASMVVIRDPADRN